MTMTITLCDLSGKALVTYDRPQTHFSICNGTLLLPKSDGGDEEQIDIDDVLVHVALTKNAE